MKAKWILAQESGQREITPGRLIPAMLARFMDGDRVFAKARRLHANSVESGREQKQRNNL
ncbi:DUF2274 domain-containing protein [Acetobacter lovaniensis]|uniref:DUF2274 domain-containing protein n=1 Tax=Acetobacter lovaniensis TaxID=104100 RepID=UPI00209EF5A8|nr:DUF2274 domain-containing protein [Acetobacter lovaniensis]